MFNFLEENTDISKICQKIKETGDKSGKEGLPGMMPMGNVGDLTRKKENCEPTGLVMIDIDPPCPPVEGGKDHAGCAEIEKRRSMRSGKLI